VRRLFARVGRRGSALLFFALVDFVTGLGLAGAAAGRTDTAVHRWLGSMVPLWVWAAVPLVAAAVIGWQAFCRRDMLGFAVAMAVAVLWAGVGLVGWIAGVMQDGWSVTIVYGAFAVFIALIAGWPEPGGGRGPGWTPPSSSRS
jgi:hypothetical protein